jgi:hypothetical protein
MPHPLATPQTVSEASQTEADAPADPRGIRRIRDDYRQNQVPRFYWGPLHFFLTCFVTLSGMAVCIWLLRDVTALELLTVPIAFVYANLAEYWGHRVPMHRRKWYAPMIYDGHTHIHHRFYPEEAFAYERTRDWHALLLPAWLIFFFLGLFALPMGALLYFLISPNVGLLLVATALGYFLTYELLHFCYHAPEDSWLLRLPFMRALRQHHKTHHNLRLMTRYNFNITFPIFDWIFRTTYAPPASPGAGAADSRSQAEALAEGPAPHVCDPVRVEGPG